MGVGSTQLESMADEQALVTSGESRASLVPAQRVDATARWDVVPQAPFVLELVPLL